MWDVLQTVVMAAAVTTIYLIPTIIGFGRKARHAAPAAILNVTLGWTVIGWIGAMLLAAGPVDARQPQVQRTPTYPPPTGSV